MELEQHAEEFAAIAHAGQQRKYTGESYIVHPREVASIVRSVPHTHQMVAAAFLHDVIEDCGVTFDTLWHEFGQEVASLVLWVTDVSRPVDGNRAVRKALDREHVAAAPAEAQTVKLADLISNSRSITAHDPNFAKVYMREKAALLDVLVRGDAALLAEAHRIVAGYK